MKQELNLLDGYTPTNDLLNDAKQIMRYLLGQITSNLQRTKV